MAAAAALLDSAAAAVVAVVLHEAAVRAPRVQVPLLVVAGLLLGPEVLLLAQVPPEPVLLHPLPLATTFTHSESLSLKYDVSVAVRSASRLRCSVPEAAVVNPGSSKITHEPASISVRMSDMVGLSVVTLISVPARTLLAVCVYSLPLRLRTTGG